MILRPALISTALRARPLRSTTSSFILSSFATSSSGPTEYQKRQMGAKETVEAAIAGHKVVVFSKSYCPYCKAAKARIGELDVADVDIYELDEREDGAEIQAYLLDKTKQRTVPNIFISQTHIGGSDDLQAALRKGTVQELLAK
ncbi:monothiol glutaredoxin [Ceratobasidium sp. AG-Ba]|nr:monothiol glutaredoxin [Ceratobasidium sp. AG-Ba]